MKSQESKNGTGNRERKSDAVPYTGTFFSVSKTFTL